MNKEAKSYYAVLDLEAGASLDEVREQWRTLSQIWHPDKHPPGTKSQAMALKKQQELNEAYDFLASRLEGKRESAPALKASTASPTPEDPLMKRAQAGEAEAQYQLACQFESGEVRRQDFRQAEQWLLKACRQNHVAGLFRLGEIYFEGRGIDRDLVEAFTWWKKAAAAEHAGAQYKLGLMYENGTGVGKDLKKALAWYKLASGNGDSQATIRSKLLDSIAAGQDKTSAQTGSDKTAKSKQQTTPWFLNSDRDLTARTRPVSTYGTAAAQKKDSTKSDSSKSKWWRQTPTDKH
jgi:TPR repeat protein